MVEYEGECDPYTHSCFVGCEDDDCLVSYFYLKVQKQARDVHDACGANVIDCETASTCLVSDTDCTLTYCSPETAAQDEACEDLTEAPPGAEEEIATSSEEILLP